MRSPGSNNGSSASITASTAAPACTNTIALRGRFSALTNSSSVRAPTTFLPCPRSLTNASVREVVRLNTATVKPLLSIFNARFCPITAMPMTPISQVPVCCSAMFLVPFPSTQLHHPCSVVSIARYSTLSAEAPPTMVVDGSAHGCDSTISKPCRLMRDPLAHSREGRDGMAQ